MIDKLKVQDILDTIRPMLQADGGDVKLVRVNDDGTIEVELEGACKGCPMSELTLANSVERILMEQIPEVTAVVPIDLEF